MRRTILLKIKWLILVGLIVFLDQVTKIYMTYILSFGETIKILPFLDFTLLANDGVAFSLFANHAVSLSQVFIIISCLFSIYMIYWLFVLSDKQSVVMKISFMLILGGAIGNLIDRVFYGYVIDFIHLFYRDMHWPVFNLADTAISIGAFYIFIDLLKFKKNI